MSLASNVAVVVAAIALIAGFYLQLSVNVEKLPSAATRSIVSFAATIAGAPAIIYLWWQVNRDHSAEPEWRLPADWWLQHDHHGRFERPGLDNYASLWLFTIAAAFVFGLLVVYLRCALVRPVCEI